jgi:copper(I)-binding protein
VNRALRAATLGVLLFSPVALSACSAGQVSQTATQERDKTGAMAQVGDIALRQVLLAYPPGGTYDRGDDAELTLAIVNSGDQPDTLVDVSGTDFAGAEIGVSASASASPSAQATPGGPAAATPSGIPTPSGTATPSGTTTPSETATATTPAGASEIVIPPDSTVFVGSDGYTITLKDLDRSLTTGQYIQVTFRFEKAGEATVLVTVDNPPTPERASETFNFHDQGNE